MRTSSKRKEGTTEVEKTREGGSLPDKCIMAVIHNGSLDFALILKLRWGRDQYLQWVRKGVLDSSLVDTGEPRIGNRMVQHVQSMLVEGVARPEQCHHVQQCKLVLVE